MPAWEYHRASGRRVELFETNHAGKWNNRGCCRRRLVSRRIHTNERKFAVRKGLVCGVVGLEKDQTECAISNQNLQDLRIRLGEGGEFCGCKTGSRFILYCARYIMPPAVQNNGGMALVFVSRYRAKPVNRNLWTTLVLRTIVAPHTRMFKQQMST